MKNEIKQSSVEYYAKQLEILADKVFKIGLTLDEFRIKKHELFEQAKEMEKQQRMSDFTMGITNANRMEETKDAEQWYNETYGGNK